MVSDALKLVFGRLSCTSCVTIADSICVQWERARRDSWIGGASAKKSTTATKKRGEKSQIASQTARGICTERDYSGSIEVATGTPVRGDGIERWTQEGEAGKAATPITVHGL